MANSKPTAQTGALTLVLLVRLYRNQMIALLVKNGIVVSDNSSDQQIATLMANLLKVSKSYFQDLNNFITNPTVATVIASGLGETAQYFKMSGNGYMNFTETPDEKPTDPALPAPSNTNANTPAPTWWSGIKANLGGYLSDGIKLIGTMNTNNANVEIANARALVEKAKADAIIAGSQTYVDPTSGQKVNVKDGTPDKGMSTTTIVVLSLVGVALLGTVIYFVARPKSS